MPHWSFPQMFTLSFHGVAGCPAVTTGEGALWHGVPQTLELWESETSTSLRSLRSDTLQRILQDIGLRCFECFDRVLCRCSPIVIGGSIYDGGILRWNFTRDRLRELHLDFFGCRSAFLFSNEIDHLHVSAWVVLSSQRFRQVQALSNRPCLAVHWPRPGIAPESDTSVCFSSEVMRSYHHHLISIYLSNLLCDNLWHFWGFATQLSFSHSSREVPFWISLHALRFIKEQPGDPLGIWCLWCSSNMEACV